jgi:hypothetical protein
LIALGVNHVDVAHHVAFGHVALLLVKTQRRL